MKSHLLALAVLILAITAPAGAQATRTWISGVGDDVNPCSRTAPCKTFGGAISKTAAGGEIDCLDPGGFGAVTITKAVTLDCTAGLVGSILSSGFNGININANSANDVVTIRNLTINGSGTGVIGINVTSVKELHLEHVAIFNHTTAGIQVNTTNFTALTMRDVTISDITATGISLGTTVGTASADLRDVRILNCSTGILGLSNSIATLQNAVVSLNSTAVRQNAASSQINVSNSQLTSNGTAFQGSAGATIRAAGNTIAQNGTAFNPNGGTIATDTQNIMLGNTSNGSVAGTISRM